MFKAIYSPTKELVALYSFLIFHPNFPHSAVEFTQSITLLYEIWAYGVIGFQWLIVKYLVTKGKCRENSRSVQKWSERKFSENKFSDSENVASTTSTIVYKVPVFTISSKNCVRYLWYLGVSSRSCVPDGSNIE